MLPNQQQEYPPEWDEIDKWNAEHEEDSNE
jgi:hypothetical protein